MKIDVKFSNGEVWRILGIQRILEEIADYWRELGNPESKEALMKELSDNPAEVIEYIQNNKDWDELPVTRVHPPVYENYDYSSEFSQATIRHNTEGTWMCPHLCGKRVTYGTSCSDCAERHEPVGEETLTEGIGISEIANQMGDGDDENPS